MGKNEMMPMRGLPLRVRLNEGLGVVSAIDTSMTSAEFELDTSGV